MKKIKKLLAILLVLVIAMSICGCRADSTINKVNDESFDEFCNRLFTETIQEDSLNSHFKITDPDKYGITFNEEDYTLGKCSMEDTKEGFESAKKELDILKNYDRASLSEEQQLTYDVLLEYMTTQVSFEGSEELINIFAPSSGLIANVSTTFIEYQFYDKEDVDHYLLYLLDVDNYMQQAFEYVKAQSEAGYYMCDYVVDDVIEQCQQYIDAETEPLIITFDDRIDKLEITDDEKEQYKTTNKEYVEQYYLPIYQETIDVLTELKGTGKNDGGLCNYGDEGLKYYEAILRDKTSSEYSPEELIELLEDTLSDVLKEISAIYISDSDTYDGFYDYQPDFETPEAALNYVIDKMKNDFPDPVTTNYSIEYQNKACEVEGTVAYYVQCRIDDTSINNIKVNGSEVDGNTLSLYTTLSHEGYPGHLYEYTSFYNNKDIPDVRKVLDFIGASEGWAQYTSNLAVDYLDINDHMKRLIYLNDIFSYILCSRVDIGVNYEGWDIDDSFDYLSQYIDCDEDTNESIYYSAVGDPGLLLPYTTGYIMMNQMREKAEKELGDNFNAKEYHQWLLNVGVAPFNVYESELDKWLGKSK